MFSQTPVLLFCVLLICLPLAVVFNLNHPRSSTENNLPKQFYLALTKSHKSLLQHQNLRKLSDKVLASPPPPPPPPPPEDDDSLFRVASRVNRKPPDGSQKKLAFMFLTISSLPFAPLWELYFNGIPKNMYNIYIHADPGYVYNPQFSGVFSDRVIHSKPALRHTPTLIAAARRLLANALLDDPSNYMFALLSPSCIPIHSFNFTYNTLIPSVKSFIEILKDEPMSFDRWSARGEDAMLPEVSLEDFRIGSQFWVLTRRHARLVVSDRKLWAKFNKPCVNVDSCYPEENYFPTLMNLREPRGSVRATLTHVDWTFSYNGHPRTYEDFEVEPDLIHELRKSRPRYGHVGTNGSDPDTGMLEAKRRDPFLFARKFTPECIEALVSIAKDVILKD